MVSIGRICRGARGARRRNQPRPHSRRGIRVAAKFAVAATSLPIRVMHCRCISPPSRGMAKCSSADKLILLVPGTGPSRWRSHMAREVIRQSNTVPATSLLALALGAAAFGAVAIGALAIGRLAVGRLAIKKARFGVLEVD